MVKFYAVVVFACVKLDRFNALIGTVEQRTIIQKNGTLAVDEWAVTFGTSRRGLGGLALPSTLQCTNFILFDVAL